MRFQERIQEAIAHRECCFRPNSTPYYCKDAGFDKPQYTSTTSDWYLVSGTADINKPSENWRPTADSFKLTADAYNSRVAGNGPENTITSGRNSPLNPENFVIQIGRMKNVQAKLKEETLVELTKVCSYSIAVGPDGIAKLNFNGWKNCKNGQRVAPGTGTEDAIPLEINRFNTSDKNSSPQTLVQDVLRLVASGSIVCPEGQPIAATNSKWQISLATTSVGQTTWSITRNSQFYNYIRGTVECPQVNTRTHVVQLSDGMVWVLEATVDYTNFSITDVEVKTELTNPNANVSGNSALINGPTGTQIVDYGYDEDDEFKQTKLRFVISGVYQTTLEDKPDYTDNTSPGTPIYYKIYNNLATDIGVDLSSYNGLVVFLI